MAHANLLEVIARSGTGLRPAETKVADAILADPDNVIRSSMASLAATAEVSEPTVLRFCRSIGCEGFSEFKVQLAQSLVRGTPYAHVRVSGDDSEADVVMKIFGSCIDTLASVRDQLDASAVRQATDALARARRIEFYGVGASGIVAADAQHKFFRLGMPCIAYADSHMQIMSAATLGTDDVVLAISHTGRTRAIIDSCDVARAAGATVIAITSRKSPLSETCPLTLAVDIRENTDFFTPMTSRLAHLAVVDVLAVGVALRRGQATTERLGMIKESLKRKRLEKGAA